MKKHFFLLICLILSYSTAFGQTLTQTIRGTVIDKDSKAPMIGATVVVLNSQPVIGAVSDAQGKFRLEKVPVGRHTLKISFLGYEELFLKEIQVTSGKELVLNAEIIESVIMAQEVVIRPTVDKEKPINEMATVSARTFSVEETQRYAASVNDPARMASAFAGVVAADDGNNTIVIRGNSPAGLLWRLEGVDIPNPNHFANGASAGGGISILSTNVLANSDFMTGAFPAEYGNATAGVFDLHLRKGNNEKREFTGRIGVLGIDLATEGPLRSGGKGSYLINYRYSTLGILGAMGLKVIGDYVTTFQDLSFNLNLPVSDKHSFSVFGIGGRSNQFLKADKDSTKWTDSDDGENEKYATDMAAAGVSHTWFLGSKTYLKSVIMASGNQIKSKEDTLTYSYQSIPVYNNLNRQEKYTFTSSLNHKFSSRSTVRAGFFINQLRYRVTEHFLNDNDVWTRNIEGKGSTQLLQVYGQWKYKLTKDLTFNSGLYGMYLGLNQTSAVEPRLGVQWAFSENQSLSFGYGLHSQAQLLTTYLHEIKTSDGKASQPNKDLGFTKSHHLLLGYDRMLSQNMHLKLEAYHQYLYNIPIKDDKKSNYAVINELYNFPEDSLTNAGTGRNYGVELTLEHFLTNGFYFMLTGSLYQSKYTGGDGIERNTRFNGNYASNLLIGKEFKVGRNGKNNVLGFNTRLVYLGGYRFTPVDLEKSRLEGETELIEEKAFESKVADYIRPDIRVSYQINRPKVSHMLSLDLQNAINRQNVAGQYYNKDENKIDNYFQAGIIPVLAYRIDF